jgi:hypothetical protein
LPTRARIEDDNAPQIIAQADFPSTPISAGVVQGAMKLSIGIKFWFFSRCHTFTRLPKPSLNRWIAEALIDHHRVIEKIRADIPAGELTLEDMESFNDQPIARGMGDTATDAIKTMSPLPWRAPRNG